MQLQSLAARSFTESCGDRTSRLNGRILDVKARFDTVLSITMKRIKTPLIRYKRGKKESFDMDEAIKFVAQSRKRENSELSVVPFDDESIFTLKRFATEELIN